MTYILLVNFLLNGQTTTLMSKQSFKLIATCKEAKKNIETDPFLKDYEVRAVCIKEEK